MKTQKWINLAFAALVAVSILQSCSKEDELVFDPGQTSYTVRPDFATLDTRPPQVIAQFRITEKDAQPVELLKSAKAGGKYALVIGISNYSGTANDLEYCDDDANDWKGRLQAEGYTITSLLDLNATKANIEAAVNALAAQSIAGSEIALCYSGHGSKGSIVSTDLYYISSTWFKTKFANTGSTKMFFCFDACQIGAMATDLNASGRIIAVASSRTSYSYDGESDMKNGIFTYYQMKGFDSVGYIYVEPDCDYANTQFKAWASQYHIKVAPSYTDSFTGNFDL
jgi:hypothetical protein